ncbi:MAG: NAD-dependent succinate-semialdehyde dehydrogenase, partial [Pseudomonadota bacterium]
MDKPLLSLVKTQAFIDGQWVDAASTFPVRDKATGEEIARVSDATAQMASDAIAAAKRAQGAWAKKTAKERAAVLRRWHSAIKAHADELALLLTGEQGKPLPEAKGEIAYGAEFVAYNAEQALRVYGETIPTHKSDARIIVIKQPVGVVAAITPWNFPNAMITRKVAPALAAGCAVVVKPAEDTPLSALALAALAEQAGLPAGLLNVLPCSDPKAVGEVLATHDDVAMVTFTGSTEVGRLLMRQASATIKRVGLELGGNAPFIVFDDCDLDAAVAGAMQCKFRNAGQTCVCANRFYVQAGVYDRFVEALTAQVRDLTVGDGRDRGVQIGPLINEAGVAKVEAHVEDAVAQGASVAVGGQRHALGPTFFEPTVLRDVTTHMRVAREETFGPVAPIFKFTTEDEVIAAANATHFGLAGYFYARDIGRVWRVAEALDFGMVGINEGVTSTPLAPFGGVKQ